MSQACLFDNFLFSLFPPKQDSPLLHDQQQTLYFPNQLFAGAASQPETDCRTYGQLHGAEPHGCMKNICFCQ